MSVDLIHLAFLIKSNKKFLISHLRDKKFNNLSDKQFLYLILFKLCKEINGKNNFSCTFYGNYNCSLQVSRRMNQLILAKCLGFIN